MKKRKSRPKKKANKTKKRKSKAKRPSKRNKRSGRALDIVTIKIPAKSKRDFEKLIQEDKELRSMKERKKRDTIFAKEAKAIGKLLSKLRTITGISKKKKK